MLPSFLVMVFLSFTQLSFAQETAPDATTTAITAEPVTAGKVVLAEGDVRFFDKDRQMRRPKVGDPIYEGESIVTGKGGEVHLNMEDGGYIGVRPGTRMRIVNFRAQGDADDRFVIRLLEGSFRSVTGWIAKFGSKNVQVRTPTATIGIRGTEHEPLVIPEGSTLGEPGTYDRVHVGETEIRTKQGSVSVRPNQAGFVSHRGAVPPRVLDRVPDFFRPTRNEKRFAGLHERIHKQLDQHREQRRQFIEQRRKHQMERGDQGKAGKAQAPGQRKQLEQRREKDGKAQHEQKQRKIDEQQRERRKLREEAREERKKQREEHRKERERVHPKGKLPE